MPNKYEVKFESEFAAYIAARKAHEDASKAIMAAIEQTLQDIRSRKDKVDLQELIQAMPDTAIWAALIDIMNNEL